MIGALDLILICPLLYLLCSKVCSLVQCDAMCDSILENQPFYKSLDNSAGWDFRGRESKFVPRLCVKYNQDQSLSLLSRRGNQLATKQMFGLLKGWWYWSFYRQVRHLSAIKDRQDLMLGTPCCWAHVYPPSLSPWLLCSYRHWAQTGVANDRGCLVLSGWIILLGCEGISVSRVLKRSWCFSFLSIWLPE